MQQKFNTKQHLHPHRLLGVISSCGGGDWPPLLALAESMRKRGHEVTLVCDSGTEVAVRKAGITAMCLPHYLNLADFFNPVLQSLFTSNKEITAQSENPLQNWAEKSIPFILQSLENWSPTLILGSLLCLELSAKLARIFGAPWYFVNPSFHFGSDDNLTAKSDFSPLGAQMYEHWLLPPAQKATVVLHATDPVFDAVETLLPDNHFYTGPLFWEMPSPLPRYLRESGSPWILISLSTAPQPGDMEIVQAALGAIEKLPVRALVTLTPQHDKSSLGTLLNNIVLDEYIPHSMILPLCRLAISHAGHGMVLKAIYHGTPMVLVPWGRDQPGVAARAQKLGVASVVHRNDCSAATLERVIKATMTDSDLALCCHTQSLRMKEADSLSCACACLESF